MKAFITKYDEDLVAVSRRFLDAASKNPASLAVLQKYGFNDEERERGMQLTELAERSFEWERSGKAWNFLSPTPERRAKEARDWDADAKRRFVQSRFRAAETAAGWIGEGPASRWPLQQKLTKGALLALKEIAGIASPTFWLEARAELARNLEAARGDRPAGAPPPKDTTLVELRGWYERWHLLAHRVFRERPDLLAPYGLTPGKAPPRLRGKAAQAKYGERAGGSLRDAGAAEAIDTDGLDGIDDSGAPPPVAAKPIAKSLPLVR